LAHYEEGLVTGKRKGEGIRKKKKKKKKRKDGLETYNIGHDGVVLQASETL
jgi:hypothetical protein